MASITTKKVYIYTDTETVDEQVLGVQDQYFEDNFPDYTFIMCEDGKSFISNEAEDTVFIQEYFKY